MKSTLQIATKLGLAALLGCGCSATDSQPEQVVELAQELNVCNETVPANRIIDGLPAYAQCASVMNSSIYSNNGVDTATTSAGTGWVRTQSGGGYQCTEWARRYMRFRWNIDYQNGNAGSWCDGKLPTTLAKTSIPVHGDLMVFAPGVCGADSTTGHIVVVDTVDNTAGTVTFVEQNQAGRRTSKQTCGLCYLHAVANDGSVNPGAGGSSATGSGGALAQGGAVASGGLPAMNPQGGAPGATGGFPATSGGAANGGAANGGAATSGGAANGGAPSGVAGASTASGGSASGGAPSGGAPSAGGSVSLGGAPAGAGSPDSSTPDEAGCSVGPGPAARSSRAVLPFALLLAGMLLRRRSTSRRSR